MLLFFVPIINKPLKGSITIKINKKAIVEKSAIKYIGVIIDSTLSWKYHILKYIYENRAIGVMYKISNSEKLIHELIYSHLVYALSTCKWLGKPIV